MTGSEKPLRLTELAHREWKRFLRQGGTAIDATAGNGHDTGTLLEMAATSGHVYALDVQEQAIDMLQGRFGKRRNLTIVHGGHEDLATLIPKEYQGAVDLVVFNLGYLPHGDKSILTSVGKTLPALQAAEQLLRKGGGLSVLAYRGHAGGLEEAEAVEKWLKTETGMTYTKHEPEGAFETLPPVLFIAAKAP